MQEEFLGEESLGEKYVQEEFLGEEFLGEESLGEKYVQEGFLGEESLGEKYVGEKSVGEKSLGENRGRWDAGFRSPLQNALETAQACYGCHGLVQRNGPLLRQGKARKESQLDAKRVKTKGPKNPRQCGELRTQAFGPFCIFQPSWALQSHRQMIQRYFRLTDRAMAMAKQLPVG